jgi:zinc/manganese transport system substrate-binding protein
MLRRFIMVCAAAGAAAVALAACATSPPHDAAGGSAPGGVPVIDVAASTNAWGSILAQLGGARVHATAIISNPDTDPHDYEPTPADGRTIARAKLFVENGIGYDTWAAKAIAASPDPGRIVIDIGDLVGVSEGGNPHRWYSPADVEKVADEITADLEKVDAAGAAYFDAQRQAFEHSGLARYHRLIDDIKAGYAGTPVGASESIFAPLAEVLGLDLVTPARFLRATSEGTDPSAADKATIDHQISAKLIKVYVFNSQNSTPDIAAQVAAAKQAGIPVSTLTETLSPAGASFQDWQSAQLQALLTALRAGSGR